MLKKGIQVLDSNILVQDFSVKENCPDVRNARVIDIVRTLQDYNVTVHIFDPWAPPAIAKHGYCDVKGVIDYESDGNAVLN